jgi:hypothetical protein
MAVLLAYLNVPLTWRESSKRTMREAIADNIMGMSAQLAYYFFFSLFPALLLLIAIASYFPVQTLVDEVFKAMSGFAPPEGTAHHHRADPEDPGRESPPVCSHLASPPPIWSQLVGP